LIPLVTILYNDPGRFRSSFPSRPAGTKEGSMHSHGPSCLLGPISHKRRRWNTPSSEDAIRHDLVERIRREIAAGTYDTPEKWAMALDQLFREMDEG
jgi:hypothetical protein